MTDKDIVKDVVKAKSWSYSQLSGYEMCAHAHMYRKVVKLPEKQSWHLTNGNYVHKLAENYLLGKIKKKDLPKELFKFKKEFKNLLKKGAISEESFVLDKDWKHIPDGWTADNAWLRAKLDARIGNYIIDFKTGKQYDTHIHQGRLYANIHMMLNPDVDEVDIEFWYLTLGLVTSHTFYRKDLERDVTDWNKRVAVMHNDSAYLPTPHQWCKYCYVKDLCNGYL